MAGKDVSNMVNPMVDSDAVIVIARKRTNSSTNVIRKASDTRIIGHADLNYALKVDKKLSENKISGYEISLIFGFGQNSVSHNHDSFRLIALPPKPSESLMKANLRKIKMTFHSNTPMVSLERKLPDD